MSKHPFDKRNFTSTNGGDDVAKIKVCDAIMGVGKTSAAINMINCSDDDQHFIFVSQLLDEVRRVKKACPGKQFLEPFKTRRSSKSDNLVELLESGRNIATTHSLFSRCTPRVIELIRQNNYILILDEVMDVVEPLDIKDGDAQLFFDYGILSVDEHSAVSWHAPDYLRREGEYSDFAYAVSSGYVIMDEGALMIWKFPFSMFAAFIDVYILTYMFDAQLQKYYFDLCDADYEYIGARRREDGVYTFCKVEEMASQKINLLDKIHIVEDAKMNEIGEDPYALSKNWFLKAEKRKIGNKTVFRQMRTMLESFVRRRWDGVLAENILWSTHKNYRYKIAGKGYASSFLAFNYRATNEYAKKDHLMYIINVFVPSGLRMYFETSGIYVDQEAYALSVMVQWVFRSAIRNGEEIWLYVPSKRMRGLLKKWIKEVSE